ncbi:MAG: hypothetical protein QOK48_904 [Blastocatellia bacterium]|jgi:hypothetical protein|nr:hypothetical protein [Blastocatellia bacterium]
MLKKFLILAMATLLVQMTVPRVAIARTPSEKEARSAEKIKAGIAKIGTGKQAMVKVTLRDGTKLAGYLSEANEDSFVIVDPKLGVSTTVAYPQVKQVRRNNLSGGAWAVIVVGLLVAVGVVVAVAAKDR